VLEHGVAALVAVVAYTCFVMVCTDTEKTEQAALLVALAHDDWVLLERVAVVTTNKQVDYVEENSTNSQHVSSSWFRVCSQSYGE
jgi:hypothetical protein